MSASTCVAFGFLLLFSYCCLVLHKETQQGQDMIGDAVRRGDNANRLLSQCLNIVATILSVMRRGIIPTVVLAAIAAFVACASPIDLVVVKDILIVLKGMLAAVLDFALEVIKLFV